MDRRERRELLERLLVYRRVYHLRGDYDAKPVQSVRAAIAEVHRRMRADSPVAAAPAG